VSTREAEVDEDGLRWLTDARDSVRVAHDDVRRLEVEVTDAHLVHRIEAGPYAEKQISGAS
jgi:hypothetical protein